MTATQVHRILDWLRIAGFGMLLVALPISNNWMSISSFVIAGVWVLERIHDGVLKKPWREQLAGFTSNKPLLLFTSIYLLLLLGLSYTSDFKYASWDLQMKLPFVFMPMVVSTLRPLTTEVWNKLWMAFLCALVFAVGVGFLKYYHAPEPVLRGLGVKQPHWTNVREVSVFISHIRFSLMLVFGLCLLWMRFFRMSVRLVFLVLVSLFILYYLWILESATAYIIMLALLAAALLRQVLRSKRRLVWLGALAVLVSAPALVVAFKVRAYFRVKDPVEVDLQATSAGGETYFSIPENTLLENGHYIFRYIAWDELRRAWKNVSGESLDALDAQGNPYYGTLVRYLTSKGERKDSVAVYALSDAEVARVKAGETNVEWNNKSGLEQRLHRILYEINSYQNGTTANGHSVLQRMEFWRAGWHVMKKHALVGVGTGDVKQAYAEAYTELNSTLDQEHRLRAHNQYLTFFIAFGLFGGIWFLWVNACLWRNAANTLVKAYLIVVLLSYLTEDTLETQAGVTFVVFLTSVLFSVPASRQLPQE